jgi:hypothetical protein
MRILKEAKSKAETEASRFAEPAEAAGKTGGQLHGGWLVHVAREALAWRSGVPR